MIFELFFLPATCSSLEEAENVVKTGLMVAKTKAKKFADTQTVNV